MFLLFIIRESARGCCHESRLQKNFHFFFDPLCPDCYHGYNVMRKGRVIPVQAAESVRLVKGHAESGMNMVLESHGRA